MAASLTVVQLRAGYYVTMWWFSSFPVHAAAHPLSPQVLKRSMPSPAVAPMPDAILF